LSQNIDRLQQLAPEQEKLATDKINLVSNLKEQAQAIRIEQAQLRDEVEKLDNRTPRSFRSWGCNLAYFLAYLVRDEISQLEKYLKAISLGAKPTSGASGYHDLLASFSSIMSSSSSNPGKNNK
jgi:hypothetical protein